MKALLREKKNVLESERESTNSSFSSLKAVLIKADSLAITPRSSAAVLQARTFLINCCNF